MAKNRSGRVATIGDLMAAVPELSLVGDVETSVYGIAYDSREVREGELFAALRGADFDGHDFARHAVSRRASALLVEERLGVDVPQLIVANSRAALAHVAAAFFANPSAELGVIGVTGTDGKTTTSYLIDSVLRSAGLVTGMVGTVAVRIAAQVELHAARQTTPESSDIQRFLRQMVDAGATWAVLEATSHGLDLHRLDHTRFVIGAVTNITHEHLEHHKTIDAYRRAKGLLFERVATDGGTAVINVDNPAAATMLSHATGANILRYSISGQPADLRATDVSPMTSGSRFRLAFGGESVEVRLPFVGDFNVANAVCAAGVTLAAGLSLEEIANGLEGAEPVPGRMARVELGQPFDVIVDYAHTPESLTKILRLLRSLYPGGKLIVVTGSAGERDLEKRPLQGRVCAELADYAVFTSEDPRNEDPDEIIEQIAAGAVAAGAQRSDGFVCITDRREAVAHAIGCAREGDCVLLAGKGHEGSIIWGREKRPWDEAEVVSEVLRELGFVGDR